MNPFPIDTRAEYDYCMARGIQPLAHPRFYVDINLRVKLQREICGRAETNGDIVQANQKFYVWAWAQSDYHYCEECMTPLRQYSAGNISHILTRKAHPDMAHDYRNVNFLCARHHTQWETGNRKTMRIYEKNLRTIEALKLDYQKQIPSDEN